MFIKFDLNLLREINDWLQVAIVSFIFHNNGRNKFSQKYLGELFNVSRWTIARALSDLQENGYITYHRVTMGKCITTQIILTDKTKKIMSENKAIQDTSSKSNKQGKGKQEKVLENAGKPGSERDNKELSQLEQYYVNKILASKSEEELRETASLAEDKLNYNTLKITIEKWMHQNISTTTKF